MGRRPANSWTLSLYLILAPFCILNGFQFALEARVYGARKKTAGAIGRMYGLDALGDMLGGVLFAWLFAYHLTPLEGLYVVALLNIGSALSLLLFYERRRKLLAFPSLLPFLYWYAGMTGLLKKFEALTSRMEGRGFNLIETRSSCYGNRAITRYGDLYSLYENGVLAFTPSGSSPRSSSTSQRSQHLTQNGCSSLGMW